jgi:alpha-beta hydrolase superfamily lysophospholipase
METGSFTNADGLKIFTRYWPIQGDAKAVVIIVHGLGEHSGRYLHVADALNQAGYICYSLDHSGHGNSEGKRVQVANTRQFILDLKQYYDSIKAKYPNEKIFILGHSMGSVISLQFVYTYPDAIDALVVTGTATDVKSEQSSLLVTLLTAIHSFAPHLRLGQPLNDPAALTRNPEFQQLWIEDTLVNKGRTPISILKYILDTGEMLQEIAEKITVPILIMHGEADEIAPISGSRIMYKRIGSKDKTVKTWPEMHHEIMNEIGYEAVLKIIIEWVNQH